MAGVNQVVSPITASTGVVKFANALKIVNITTIFTTFVAIKSNDPCKGR